MGPGSREALAGEAGRRRLGGRFPGRSLCLWFYNPEEKGGCNLDVDRKLVSLVKTE